MSRENAIKFLRDIRGGIEALQNAYAPITRGADRSSPLKLLTTNALEEERVGEKRQGEKQFTFTLFIVCLFYSTPTLPSRLVPF